MPMPLPKIVYPSGGGTELNFTYAPVNKPGANELKAIRHDSDTISGLRQSFLERIEEFWTIEVNNEPQTTSTAWRTFMLYALAGGSFDFYHDATVGTFETFTLEDTTWAPSFAFRGFDKFKIKLRKVIA